MHSTIDDCTIDSNFNLSSAYKSFLISLPISANELSVECTICDCTIDPSFNLSCELTNTLSVSAGLMEKQDLDTDTDTDMDTDMDICTCTMVGLDYWTYPYYLF